MSDLEPSPLTPEQPEVQITGVHQEVAQRLREIYLRDGEDLNERAVVQDAADPTSPLHTYFEWDGTEAAARYRLSQAASLIRKVRVTVIRGPASAPIRGRAYYARKELSASAQTGNPGSYVAIEQVAGKTAWEASLRDSMLRDVRRLKKRYDDASMLFDVFEEVFGPLPEV